MHTHTRCQIFMHTSVVNFHLFIAEIDVSPSNDISAQAELILLRIYCW